MNSTMGLWVATLLLAIAAAYGNIQYFKQQTAMELNGQLLKTATAAYLVDECQNENIKKLMLEEIKIREALDHEQQRANELEFELRNARLARDREKRASDHAIARATELENTQKELRDRMKSAEDESNKLREDAANYKEFVNDKERLETEIAKLTVDKSELESDNEKLAQEREGLIKSARGRINNLQTVNADLKNTLTQRAEEVRKRGDATAERNNTVGEILEVDLANRFCVVDLGSVNNVRRGMRFEVGRWQRNEWRRLGIIELINVNPTTSAAMVVDLPTVYKQCPVTGYIAADIEEQFSPYAATRLGEAIKLETIERDAASTMKESDPVITGDKLRSKIYQRDRKLRFAFVGQPVTFSEDLLRNRVVSAGNIFQDAIDTDTDFLIVGKVEDIDAPVASGTNVSDRVNSELEEAYQIVKKAKDAQEFASRYGIPIMREVALNDFLRN